MSSVKVESKANLKKEKDTKTSAKKTKIVKDLKDKIPKNKKKIKKKDGIKEKNNDKANKIDEAQTETVNETEEEPVISNEILLINKQIDQIDDILQVEKSISNKLEIMINSENNSTFSLDNFKKIDKNAMHRSNLIIEKYNDSLSNVSTLIKNTIENLEDSKYFKEENKNLNYRLEMLALDKVDKKLINEKRYYALSSALTNEVNEIRTLITNQSFTVPFNYVPQKDKILDESEMRNFFQNMKYFLKNVTDSIKEKDKELNFLQYDNRSILDEINSIKFRIDNEASLSNNYPTQNQLRGNFSLLSNDFPFSMKSSESLVGALRGGGVRLNKVNESLDHKKVNQF